MMNENINSHLRKLIRWADGEPLVVEVAEPEVTDTTVRADASNTWLERESLKEKTFRQRLDDWRAVNEKRVFQQLYQVFSVVVCLILIVTMLITVSFLPEFGNPTNPANNEVPQRYIERGPQETGTVNVVAGMILDYRAFDTLGESHVLFIAACCVLILLRLDRNKEGKAVIEDMEGMDHDTDGESSIIVRITTAPLIPIIFIFGIYIILFGHLSPGGGFSGGAIMGGGLILYRNAYGEENSHKLFNYNTFKWISFVSLMFYSIMKGYSFFMGANHLDSGIPLGTLGNIISAGLIVPLNICVGCVVACTMYTLYSLFCKGEV